MLLAFSRSAIYRPTGRFFFAHLNDRCWPVVRIGLIPVEVRSGAIVADDIIAFIRFVGLEAAVRDDCLMP